MYKGIILKKLDKPRYLQNQIKINYKVEEVIDTSIPASKEVKISYDTFLEGPRTPENFFEVGRSYMYHDTLILSPIDTGLKKNLSAGNHPTHEFYDRFNYNSTAYNEFAANLSELETPNFYLSKTVSDNNRYKEIFAFSGDITSREIFKNSYSLNNLYNTRETEEINRMRNIFLSKTAKRYSETQKRFFPYAVDIKLNFKDIDVMSTLMDNHDIHKSSISLIESIPKEEISFQVTTRDMKEDTTNTSNISVSSMEDLLDFAYFPRDGGLVYLPDDTVRSRYSENIVKMKARTEYNKIAAANIPSIHTILNGDNVQNEILYVKMEKYAGAVAAGNLVQNIWLRDSSIINDEQPKKSKFGVYDYYDTQVKLGETYTYIIKAYVVIYGAEIRCTAAEQNGAKFTLLPSFKITEVELTRKTITVLPPIQLPPFVHPYHHDIENRIFFHLHLEQGQKFMDYKVFTEQDEEFFRKIYDTSQYNKPEHAFINEKAVFEVFRLEHKPERLQDFSNRKITQISREGIKTSAIFSEKIRFDKDYYYLFRTLNFLDYPSNPSKIYKINLQKGVERNNLLVETFNIQEEPQEYNVDKKFTKLIHISPNIRDVFMDPQPSENLDTYTQNLDKVKMGLNPDSSIWGKIYKIRIKSNNTGKKIDINVRFKLTREQ